MEQQITLAGNSPLGPDGQVVTFDTNSGNVFLNGKRTPFQLAQMPDDVHSPAEIPTYLAGYRNGEFRADDVSTVFPVTHRRDKYRQEDADDAFLYVDVAGSIQGSIPQIDPKSALSEYACTERFVGSYVARATEDEEVGTRYRLRQAAAKRCATAMKIYREKEVWDLLTTTANWSSANHTTLLAAAKWNGGASSDPIADINGIQEASAMECRDVWMNRRTFDAFLRNASVREHMRQMMGDMSVGNDITRVNGGGVTGDAIDVKIPGLPTIRVVGSKFRTVSAGALSYILGNDVVVTCSPNGDDVATTRTFRVKGSQGVGYESREYRVEDRGPQGGTMLVCHAAEVAVMTATNVGGVIKAAWQ